jgi:outer membrane protein assembly factor BamD (BamD/ComL family)
MDNAEKYYLKGVYDEAIEACRESLKYDMNENNRARVWYIMGQAWLMKKNTKNARIAFANILSRYSDTAWLADAYLGIGDSHYEDGNYEKSIQYYENSMTKKYLAQHGASVYYRLARAHRKNKNESKALFYENVIRTQYPHSLEARILLATGSIRHSTDNENSPKIVKRLYSVQISYTTRADYAREYAEKFKEKGYESFVNVTTSGGKQRFKVLVGKFNSVEAAQALMRELKAKYNVEAFITHISH